MYNKAMICVEDIKVPEVFQKGEIIKISGTKELDRG